MRFAKQSTAFLCAGAMLATIAVQPAAAQYRNAPDYNNGYSDGYRAGYDDGHANRRYNDRQRNDVRRNDFGRDNRRGENPDQRWRARYNRTYTYRDDHYYQQCRNQPDPAGIIVGAIIGGLIGNAAGNNRAAPTLAGIVIGGVAGAALTNGLNCADQSYAYRAYYDGFNSGRANSTYNWRNPRNGHRGVFRVGDYYNDPDGFRCATYSQTIYVGRRPQEARGRACRQPDGTWAIVQ